MTVTGRNGTHDEHMTNAPLRIRIRKTLSVAVLVGSVVGPAAVITASPATAAAAGFENMPPA